MIPQDFLASYVAQYQVTPEELEVIDAVLAGKSIEMRLTVFYWNCSTILK